MKPRRSAKRTGDRGATLSPRPAKEGAGDPDVAELLRRILASPSYLRADDDPGLLARDELRASRLQLEYLKAELVLEDEAVRSTIVVFGSTRIVEPQQARQRVENLRRSVSEHPDDAARQRQLDVAERILARSHYYEIAQQFGRLVSSACQADDRCEFVIVTGGGPGIMEAANRGAFDVGAKSVGLNITLQHEQHPNPYITPELCLRFRYFALRKMHFLQRAKALVAFPGGYGTFDELFDALCLLQTRKITSLPVVLVGEEFWRKAFDAEFLAAEGLIDADDVNLFTYAESAEEIWQTIRRFRL